MWQVEVVVQLQRLFAAVVTETTWRGQLTDVAFCAAQDQLIASLLKLTSRECAALFARTHRCVNVDAVLCVCVCAGVLDWLA